MKIPGFLFLFFEVSKEKIHAFFLFFVFIELLYDI